VFIWVTWIIVYDFVHSSRFSIYCGMYKAVTTSWHQMWRVSVSAIVNNCGLWISLLNILDFNSYNYNYSLHRFTTHKPETCLLVWYHFTSYLIVPILAISLLTVCLSILDWLSCSSGSSSPSLNCSYLCLHLLKTVFRQQSREHFVEGFSLSVVTKTTLPLCRKRLSMYALSRECVYSCHPDNDAYSALIAAIVQQWTATPILIFGLLGGIPHCSLLKAVRDEQPNSVLPFPLFEVCACNIFFCFAVSFLPVVCSPPATSTPSLRVLISSNTW
jgi:hypothetical protein